MFFRFCLSCCIFPVISIGLAGCKKGVQEQQDELYSRHLQRQVKLTIISTPIPDDKSELNLLVLNDGQEADDIRVTAIVDSMYRTKQIGPLVIAGIQPGDRKKEFGIADKKTGNQTGEKADHYDSFFNNELYPFAKKKAGVRKFKSVTIAGFGAGGLSALDIAWNHPDKISKAGVFSGAFNRKDDTQLKTADSICTGMMYEKVRSSRKRPDLQFWIYAGQNGKTTLANDDSDNIQSCSSAFVELLSGKKFVTNGDIVYRSGATNDIQAWQKEFPDFLKWAVGK